MDRKTDKEIYDEYLQIVGGYIHPLFEGFTLRAIAECRVEEPRINSGYHFYDYINIVDDDDNMDSYYGEDYFK